jgi:hypothetical protein
MATNASPVRITPRNATPRRDTARSRTRRGGRKRRSMFVSGVGTSDRAGASHVARRLSIRIDPAYSKLDGVPGAVAPPAACAAVHLVFT